MVVVFFTTEAQSYFDRQTPRDYTVFNQKEQCMSAATDIHFKLMKWENRSFQQALMERIDTYEGCTAGLDRDGRGEP